MSHKRVVIAAPILIVTGGVTCGSWENRDAPKPLQVSATHIASVELEAIDSRRENNGGEG